MMYTKENTWKNNIFTKNGNMRERNGHKTDKNCKLLFPKKARRHEENDTRYKKQHISEFEKFRNKVSELMN